MTRKHKSPFAREGALVLSPCHTVQWPTFTPVQWLSFAPALTQVGARLDGSVPDTVKEQIEVIFERIQTILAASRMTFTDVAKLTVYATDPAFFEQYFSARAEIFGAHNPPATLLVVDKFPRPGVQVEIEVVAANTD